LKVKEAKNVFEDFKVKNKTLYKIIYQGVREIDGRKKNLYNAIQSSNPNES
jgi:hypothetical protein